MLSVFLVFLFVQVGQRFLPVFCTVISLSGPAFEIHFRVRVFVFAVLVVVLCFWWCFSYIFVCFCSFSHPNKLYKNPLHIRFSFFGFVLSVLGFASTSFVVFQKMQLRANRTPHTPARFWFVPFSFFSLPRLCHRPFWPCVPSSGILSG